MVELVDLSGMDPQVAAERTRYLALRIWQEQNLETPFIKDPRPEYYLRNEIQAFWQGRIQEIHGFADPIGQAVQWLRDNLIPWMQGFYNQVIKPFIAPVVDWVTTQAQRIWDFLVAIYNRVAGAVTGVVSNVLEGLGVVQTWISSSLGNIWGLIQSEFTAGWNYVRTLLQTYLDGFNTLAGGIRDMLVGAWEDITTAVSGKFETLTGAMAALPESIASAFQSAISYIYDVLSKLWSDVIVPAEEKIKGGLSWIAGQIHALMYSVWGSIQNVISGIAPITPERGENLGLTLLGLTGMAAGGLLGMTAVWDILHPFKDIIPNEIKAMIYDVTNFKLILGGLAGVVVTAAIIQPSKYAYNALLRPYLPRLAEAEEMLHKQLIDKEHYRRLCHYWGYSDFYTEAFLKLTEKLPPPQDLVRFVVREVHLMPKDYNTPDFFIKYMGEHGYSDYWARAYWWSHWELPAYNHMQTAFFRGLISQDEFLKYVEWHDYSPMPRPGISRSDRDIMADLIYDLPQRLQARMMRRWGLITTDQHRDLLRQTGLHPQWLDLVARAEALNLIQDERTAYRNALKNQYLWGMIDTSTLRRDLESVNYTPEEVELSVRATEEQFRYETIKDAIDAVRTQYRLRKITLDELQARLVQLGIQSERIERIVSVELARAAEIKQETPEEKVYSYGQGVALARFKDGVTTQDELAAELAMLGYNEQQIAKFRILANLERDHQMVKQIITIAKTAYKKGLLDDSGFMDMLREYGLWESRIVMELTLLRIARGLGLASEDVPT